MTTRLTAAAGRAPFLMLTLSVALSASCRAGGGGAQNNRANENAPATHVAADPTPGAEVANVNANANTNAQADADTNAAVTQVRLVACPTPTPGADPSQSRARPLVAKLINAMRTVETAQASMQVTTCNEQVSVKGSTQGEFSFKLDGNKSEELLVKYRGNKTHSILYRDETLEFYQPRLNQVIRMSNESAKLKGYGRYSNRYTHLIRNAVVTHLGDETVGGARTALLQLTPRRRDRYKVFYVWVDYERAAPVQVMLVEAHATTTVKLSNLKLNAPLDDEAFKLNYPRGTRVIKQ